MLGQCAPSTDGCSHTALHSSWVWERSRTLSAPSELHRDQRQDQQSGLSSQGLSTDQFYFSGLGLPPLFS